MEGTRTSHVAMTTAIVVLAFIALLFIGAPLVVHAQQQDTDTSFWERTYVGLQLKTWVVITILVVVISLIVEGLGWLLAVAAIGYVLWLLLR